MLSYLWVDFVIANILRLLKRVGFFDTFGPKWLFPSVQSAVEFAKSGNKVVSNSYSWPPAHTQAMDKGTSAHTHTHTHARTHARIHTHTLAHSVP